MPRRRGRLPAVGGPGCAAFVAPLSLVFDRTGLYYDGRGRPTSRPCSSRVTLARTKAGRRPDSARPSSRRTSPSTMSAPGPCRRMRSRRPARGAGAGQVADDKAVLIGRPEGFGEGQNVNAILLERRGRANPHAFVIFKTHPDVEHLGESGRTGSRVHQAPCRSRGPRHPDRPASVPASRIENLFVACRIRRPVARPACGGHPWPALLCRLGPHGGPCRTAPARTTQDPRRNRRGSLIRYARYWDPATGLPCPPHVVLRRIEETRAAGRNPHGILRLAAGRAVIAMRRLTAGIRGMFHGAR